MFELDGVSETTPCRGLREITIPLHRNYCGAHVVSRGRCCDLAITSQCRRGFPQRQLAIRHRFGRDRRCSGKAVETQQLAFSDARPPSTASANNRAGASCGALTRLGRLSCSVIRPRRRICARTVRPTTEGAAIRGWMTRQCAQPISIRLGAASRVFFSVSVSTPSSSWALICCWSILLDSVKDRAKWPTLYSV